MRRRRKRLGKDSNKADYRAPRPASSTQRRPADSDYSPPEQQRARAEEVRPCASTASRIHRSAGDVFWSTSLLVTRRPRHR